MKRRYWLVLALSPFVFSQPQPPSPRPEPAQTQKQQETRRTEPANKSDLAPDSANALKEVELGDHANNDPGDPPSNWWLIIPTIVIAASTMVQAYIYWKQKELMASALAETAKAANAAHDTFVSTNLPKLAIRWMSVPDGIGHSPMKGRFLLFNTGRSKAVLRKCYSEVVIGKTLPPNTPYEGKHGNPLGDIELSPGKSTPMEFPSTHRELSFEEFQIIGNRRDMAARGGMKGDAIGAERRIEDAYVIGWLEYADEANDIHVMGFCRKYNFIRERFDREPDPDYEYGDQG